ncbi:XdhC/CoxI family protein [Ahrensia sp. R2A130]|nr:XdhC/CoxI family protein [Ahrensia sp. R2A130]
MTEIASGDVQVLTQAEALAHGLVDEIKPRLLTGKSGMVGVAGAEYFIQLHLPPPRLVIIGAVHISQALAPMAAQCGYDVVVVDPRTAFATPERFTGVTLQADWPEQVLDADPLDAWTAVAAVTHDPKIDDLPLKRALDARCFYVGALGSRKTHGKRLSRFAEAGYDESLVSRIAAPIGLDIGAANPAEIAVAVMAQIIEAHRRRPLGDLDSAA